MPDTFIDMCLTIEITLLSITSCGSVAVLFEDFSCINMAFAIGTIIAEVAVLLIHIESNQVGSINPNMSLKMKQVRDKHFDFVGRVG